MESTGMSKTSWDLELTIATPGNILNSSGSNNGGNRSSNGNTSVLALLDTMDHPVNGGEEGQQMQPPMGTLEVGGGGGSSTQPRKRSSPLPREVYDQLEASFQQNNFPDKRTKEALVERLNMTRKKIDVWFVNRRSRSKREKAQKQQESYKKQVEELTKGKDRLQRKLDKLKGRNKALNKKLKEMPAMASAPAPAPAAAPVMLLPLPGALDTLMGLCPNYGEKVTDMAAAAAAALYITQHVNDNAVVVRTTGAQLPLPPSSGGSV